MALKVEYADIVSKLYDIGLDEDALRADYSGRGMYGDKCMGIVGELDDLVRFAIALGDEHADWLPNVQGDGMGQQSIFYWQRVQVEGAPNREEDDDE